MRKRRKPADDDEPPQLSRCPTPSKDKEDAGTTEPLSQMCNNTEESQNPLEGEEEASENEPPSLVMSEPDEGHFDANDVDASLDARPPVIVTETTEEDKVDSVVDSTASDISLNESRSVDPDRTIVCDYTNTSHLEPSSDNATDLEFPPSLSPAIPTSTSAQISPSPSEIPPLVSSGILSSSSSPDDTSESFMSAADCRNVASGERSGLFDRFLTMSGTPSSAHDSDSAYGSVNGIGSASSESLTASVSPALTAGSPTVDSDGFSGGSPGNNQCNESDGSAVASPPNVTDDKPTVMSCEVDTVT